jgi:peptide/nickel transport system permease protein
MLHSKFFSHLIRDIPTVISGVILLLTIILAFFPSLIAPYNPWNPAETHLQDLLKPPSWLPGGKPGYLLGTDSVGRDMLSLIVYGVRPSLIVGFSVVLLSEILGVALGIWAGFYGGWLGSSIMRIADTAYSFPALLVAIFLIAVLETRGLHVVILALFTVSWVQYCRIMFSMVKSKKEEEYITAAYAIGLSNLKVILKYLLPNCISPCLVVGFVDVARVIMLEATLSFLGIGASLTRPSLGQVIASGKEVLLAGKWWITIFPALFLIIIILSINILGESLKCELNPEITEKIL